jgi:hypothetical protein
MVGDSEVASLRGSSDKCWEIGFPQAMLVCALGLCEVYRLRGFGIGKLWATTSDSVLCHFKGAANAAQGEPKARCEMLRSKPVQPTCIPILGNCIALAH